jgi:hypothetical protein
MRIVLYHSYNVHSDYPSQHLHYLFEPSLSHSTFPYNPNYLQNQESDSVAALEVEIKNNRYRHHDHYHL